jgi:transcription initiation factor IIE alpha subunit
MSAIVSLYNYLAKGNEVTSRAARTMFKVSNVADLVYRLRNKGVAVYTNRTTLSDGTETYAYRIGSPSKAFENYLSTRHIARARLTLYRDAFSVAMIG